MPPDQVKPFHHAVIKRCREPIEAFWLMAPQDGYSDPVIIIEATHDEQAEQFEAGMKVEDRLVVSYQLTEDFPRGGPDGLPAATTPPADDGRRPGRRRCERNLL